MEQKEKFYHKLWFKAVIIVLVVLVGFSARTYLEKVYRNSQRQEGTVQFFDDGSRVGRDLDYAPNVEDDNKILQAFKTAFPDVTVLVACEEDLTDDGCDDLVVIYNTPESDEYSDTTTMVNGGHIRMMVAIDSGDGENYTFSDPIPAPIENQKIKFQNIDKEAEMEFILQGQKGSKVGYGIYRVIDGAPVNLFAEGLVEC